jgi:DNA polymerase III alpha subunit (gram-positive type)
MPNLVFLELDTTGLYGDAEIIRVVVLDAQGNPLLDRYARPSRPLSLSIASITGIINEQLRAQSIPIQDVISIVLATVQRTTLHHC